MGNGRRKPPQGAAWIRTARGPRACGFFEIQRRKKCRFSNGIFSEKIGLTLSELLCSFLRGARCFRALRSSAIFMSECASVTAPPRAAILTFGSATAISQTSPASRQSGKKYISSQWQKLCSFGLELIRSSALLRSSAPRPAPPGTPHRSPGIRAPKSRAPPVAVLAAG